MARSASSAISAGASAGYGLRRNPPDDRDHQERGVERDAALLRLAGTPFTTTLADGPTLRLLRVETEVVTDVAGLAPPPALRLFRLGGKLRSLAFAPVRQAAREAVAPD